MDKIRIGIVGYGNIGRGVELAIARNEDMELKAVFTRRDPSAVKIHTEGASVKHMDDMLSMKDEIDVMVLCGGSATDLPVMGPKIAADFNTIDSFDTHARIPEYYADMDKAAKEGGKIGIISVSGCGIRGYRCTARRKHYPGKGFNPFHDRGHQPGKCNRNRNRTGRENLPQRYPGKGLRDPGRGCLNRYP